mmetsp:Transcript_821/g.2756  ORF Transcript_821/g.2756 Transcript_821/m.2756 type:complete len:251 (+) Transcript_821:190-942(+)
MGPGGGMGGRPRRAARAFLGALEGDELHGQEREAVEDEDLEDEDAEDGELGVAGEGPVVEPVGRVLVVVARFALHLVEHERLEGPAREGEVRRPGPVGRHLVHGDGVAAEEDAELEERAVQVQRRLLVRRDRRDQIRERVAAERQPEHDEEEEDEVAREDAAPEAHHGVGDHGVDEDQGHLDDRVDRAPRRQVRQLRVEAGGHFPVVQRALVEHLGDGLQVRHGDELLREVGHGRERVRVRLVPVDHPVP